MYYQIILRLDIIIHYSYSILDNPLFQLDYNDLVRRYDNLEKSSRSMQSSKDSTINEKAGMIKKKEREVEELKKAQTERNKTIKKLREEQESAAQKHHVKIKELEHKLEQEKTKIYSKEAEIGTLTNRLADLETSYDDKFRALEAMEASRDGASVELKQTLQEREAGVYFNIFAP